MIPQELAQEIAQTKRAYDRALADGALGTGTLPSCEALSARIAELLALAETYARLMERLPATTRTRR